jgi:8-oxo-dGTP pyrophosphatase MutT (NUDIX family)
MAHMHGDFGTQFGALPFQVGTDGLRIMLLTSRETRRWVIPKGWPIRGLKPAQTAAREAFEEAGLMGTIVGKRPVGSYHYSKQLSPQTALICQVRVFLLSVDHQAEAWPEQDQRECAWFDPFRAAQLVNEGGLAEIIRDAFPSIGLMSPIGSKLKRLPR